MRALTVFAVVALVVLAQFGIELAEWLSLGDVVMCGGGAVGIGYVWFVARTELTTAASHATASKRWPFALLLAGASVGFLVGVVAVIGDPFERYDGDYFNGVRYWTLATPLLAASSLFGMIAFSLMRQGPPQRLESIFRESIPEHHTTLPSSRLPKLDTAPVSRVPRDT